MSPRELVDLFSFAPVGFGVIAFSRFGLAHSRRPQTFERRAWELGLAGLAISGLLFWFGEPNLGSWRQFGSLFQALFNLGVLFVLEIHWSRGRSTEAASQKG